MDVEKYTEALKHETPDTVLGIIMDELEYPSIDAIADACDIAQATDNQNDIDLINEFQPMFYNYRFHRLVNRADVIEILKRYQSHSES
ncbi:hypothetical protein [Lactobacillus sp. Sy-1]|uniref:hypothetical protein n=1 Tax=Lactobacillus sp. Sy-1 TaxID=2109645 RepID=UPI001C5B77DA|nr:hypothetical protein [Lactobacillus sp. Sy-1]MBW1606273.1 hypothetical protein [Lactobacillus sp. Sy-1]